MGRNVQSIRQEIENTIRRWEAYGRAMKEGDRIYLQRIIEKVKIHSGEAQYALYDPLEAVFLSILVEMEKEIEELRNAGRN